MENNGLPNQKYLNLVERLVNSPNIEDVIESVSQEISENPNFYLFLFKTVELLRANEASKGNQNVADLLNELKVKLYDYNEGIPLDLPKSILADKNLKTMYLGDYGGVAHVSEKWDAFQTVIGEKVNSIPQKSVLLFLYWCELMLEVNLVRHNQHCKKGSDCGVNQGYDRRNQYILRLIEEMTPQPVQDKSQSASAIDIVNKSRNKIQWLGTQKELAELFVELKKKGWIEKFENETIQDCFTESNSLPQYLKPSTNRKTKEDTFDNLYTGYTPLFYAIKENPKRRK
ncbi:MAG: hypothetical protein IPL65_04055 [Lewinellaceae bacterium]|nr:hypothetical protein [Lewinellaceae bacterium]